MTRSRRRAERRRPQTTRASGCVSLAADAASAGASLALRCGTRLVFAFAQRRLSRQELRPVAPDGAAAAPDEEYYDESDEDDDAARVVEGIRRRKEAGT